MNDGTISNAYRALWNEESVFKQVRDFWEIGHPEKLADRPTMPSEANLQLCLKLIREEWNELGRAVQDEDLVEMADALGDLMYVTIGMGLACGFPMREVFDEIHRTNMAKFPGGVVTRRESDNKVLKPEGWTPPDIKGILDNALEVAGNFDRCECGHVRRSHYMNDVECVQCGHPNGDAPDARCLGFKLEQPGTCDHEWNERKCNRPKGHVVWHGDGKTSWRADQEQCPASDSWRCIHPEKHAGSHVDEDGNEYHNVNAAFIGIT